MTENNTNKPAESTPGSSVPGEPGFLAVGRLRRSHGVRGDILMEVLTDFPERLRPGKMLFLGEARTPVKLLGVRTHQDMLILHLDGYDTPEQVGQLRNLLVSIPVQQVPPLPEGNYYHHQLVGLRVVDEQGELISTIEEILETGANDVLVTRTPTGKELLIPMIDPVVLRVDLDTRLVHVRLLPWLDE